jgi:hypothetical protein
MVLYRFSVRAAGSMPIKASDGTYCSAKNLPHAMRAGGSYLFEALDLKMTVERNNFRERRGTFNYD